MDNHSMMELGEKLNGKFENLVNYCMVSGAINQDLYNEYDVKRGLRDSNGKGVLTGLTEISDVCGYRLKNGKKIPCDGELYYQGYNVNDIVDGLKGRKFGFEETIYLLLFGRLPSDKDMEIFKNIMENFETLSGRFVRDVVMKASNGDIMNAMQRCILTLYTYDSKPEDISAENVLRQSIEMIAKLPLIAVYSYHSYRHFRRDETLFIRNPQKGLSLAENILLYLTLFYLLFQSLKLQAVISGIHVVHVQKLLMCTALFDSVFTDHDDLIRISDRRKTMGNGNACTVFCQMLKTFLNMTFTFVIQC